MADQDKQKDILERVSELPDDLRKALFARSTTDAIQEVGKKNALPLDKVGELADETGLVMLGITPPSEYIKNLTKRLGVEQEKAKAIAEEINQKIFQPVRESLKRVHGLEPKMPTPPLPTTSPPKRDSVSFPPPLLAKERGLGGEVIKPPAPKPLPKREDIVKPPPAPPTPPAPLIIEPMRSKEEILPPIFVKKIPEPIILPKPDIVPQQKAAKTELEKTPQKISQNKDPYHEPID